MNILEIELALLHDKKAYHGFYIVERTRGMRKRHFPGKDARKLSIARARIFDLCRSRSTGRREFEIWDGLTPQMLVIHESGQYHYKPYLRQPINREEKLGYERDFFEAVTRPKLKQQVGARRGDLNSWIKAEPLPREAAFVPAKNALPGKATSRKLGG